MGTPTEETWPGLTSLPDYIQFKHNNGTPLKDIFSAAGNDLLDLLSQLLTLCPLKVRMNIELIHQEKKDWALDGKIIHKYACNKILLGKKIFMS